MKFSTTVDWLTITNTYTNIGLNRAPETLGDVALARRRLRQNLLYSCNSVIKPSEIECSPETTINRFYGHNWHNVDGFSMSLGAWTEQGVKAQFSGHFLDGIFQKVPELYGALAHSNWKFTRVDLAYDFFDSGTSVREIWTRHIEPAFLGKKLKTSFIQSGKGDTIYIGSRYSNYMIRIYDKGKEQKTSHDWIRFELEIKKGGIKVLGGNFANDIRRGASKILGMCRSLPDNFTDTLSRISAGETFGTVYNPKIKTDRRKYVESYILPYLEKTLETEPELYEFALNELIRKFRGFNGSVEF